MTSNYRVLFLGDFFFGESYGRGRILERIGYRRSIEHLHDFVAQADTTIANFEAPIVDPATVESPLAGHRKYIHWANPDFTPRMMQWLGIDAVSLANNHTMDYGPAGLQSTLDFLDQHGIEWFGAGRNYDSSLSPYEVPVPNKLGGGRLLVAGMYQHLRGMATSGTYASTSSIGVTPLQESNIADLSPKRPTEDFNIAFPHWGQNYRGPTPRQRRLASTLTSAGYRLILGHGAHALQGMQFLNGVPVLFSIGNGVFNSQGRFGRLDPTEKVVPFGSWIMLTVLREGDQRSVSARIYPVYSDNLQTDYLPAPVSARDFERVTDFLSTPEIEGEPLAFKRGEDDLGFYLNFSIGTWPLPELPAHPADAISLRTAPPASEGEIVELSADLEVLPRPNEYADPASRELLRQMQQDRRMSGTLIMAQAATEDGAKVEWIRTNLALATHRGKGYLLSGHRGPATVIGSALVKDKLLAKEFLQKAGVATPQGRLVRNSDEAIQFQNEIGQAVVVKPRFGNTGTAVSVNITDPKDIKQAFDDASQYGDVIAEEFVDMAAEYRCLASAEECFSVTERLLPSVVGDGRHSIDELIIAKNLQRQNVISTRNRSTPRDAATIRTLRKQGYALTSILEDGKRLIVRDVGGLSSGGEPYERTGDVAQSVKDLAVAATAAIPGLYWCGSDIVVDKDGNPLIIEINTSADISGASFPLYGTPMPLGKVIWRKIQEHTPTFPEIDVHKGRAKPRQVSDSLPLQPNVSPHLDRLFADSLRAKGLEVASYPNALQRVTRDGTEYWFRNVSSVRDRSSATLMVRRYEFARRVFARQGLKMTEAQVPINPRRFRALKAKSGTSWALVNGRRAWPGREALETFSIDEISEESLKRYRSPILQELPEGRLFRVLASPNGCIVIISPERHPRVSMDAVKNVAVQAMKSIPNLAFGSIDVVVPQGSKTPLVEGISINPRIHAEWWVMYGSFDNVWDYLLRAAAE